MRDRRYAPRSGTCCPVVPRSVADALVTLLLALVHNAHDPATMAAALGRNLALAVDQDDAEVEPGKRGSHRETLAQ